MNKVVIFLRSKESIDYDKFIPALVEIDGNQKSVSSWKDVYVTTLEYLYEKWRYTILKHENETIGDIDGIVLANVFHKSVLRRGVPVGRKLFAEADLSTTDLIKILTLLIAECDASLKRNQLY